MAVLDEFSQLFARFTGEQLKILLETRHLYQKVSIEPSAIAKQLMDKLGGEKEYYSRQIQNGLLQLLTLTDNPTFGGANTIQLWLPVKNVKLFCVKCDAREASRPIWYSDMTLEILAKHRKQRLLDAETFKIQFHSNFQLFVLVYQCQRCESLPSGFIVKREGNDLYLEGRSPIEHVELPTFIPKEDKHWFRDAVIAFQTGKVLAALFYLRTFVEQFARRKTGTQNDKKTGDKILSAYAGMIPTNLRETMPSLSEWYDRLSEALHTAREDAALFESARQKIEEHFDIRRVHKLDEKERAVPQTVVEPKPAK